MVFDRRQLLASAAATGAAAGLPPLAWGDAVPAAPKASVRPVTETLHGVAVTDPYRWMENPKDPEWTPYLMGQNAHARAVLARIPGRDALAGKIGAVSGKLAAVAAVQPAGGMVFSQIRPVGANTLKLYVREGAHGADRLLYDPDTEAAAGSHFSLDYWVASPDGRYVAFGASPAGSENSVLRFMETATGKLLPETIDRAQFGAVSWTPDGAAVFFNRLKEGAKHGDPDHYADSVAWLHRLNTDPATDVKILAKGLDPAVPMLDIDAPAVIAQVGSDIVGGVVQGGVQNEIAAYASPLAAALAGKPAWTEICDRSDDITGAALFGPDIYLLSHKDAPRFKILKTSAHAPSVASATVAVPESAAVIKGLAAAKDGVYVQTLDAGLGRLSRLGADGKLTPVRLPFDGAISFIVADPMADGCWFELDSWVKPPVVCYAGPDGAVTATDIAPKPDIDVAPYESREVMVKVRDGVMVPLSIVWRKGLKRDGSAPCYLTAYGAYGLDLDPGFGPRVLPWLDLGGVYAVAHVRGGGELGDGWHTAGQKLTKPNTWRDCIDCAEYLIRQGWTSRPKLAVEGTSAGGIMIGRFLTERPDLLAVAIVRVGDSNALRAEFMEAGPANVPEFGTIMSPQDFKGLKEMDALSHVKDGVRYPAVLLTTGVNDPRVAPWEAGKFTARLQAATASGKPVILRVETDAGHGLGSTRKQRDDETADTYAFILWQTGDRRFRPPR
ncbi:MAG TPA: prolyl oligopeptidase family serine peptidase [Caulobacteraceae bacterium]|nr:prolyl oligopeptidase family serine peptidase [Caulobacteraceae bacterium]